MTTAWKKMPISGAASAADEAREAASISPGLAFNSLGIFCAYFLKLVLPNSSPYVFSTVSNVSFLTAAFYLQYRITNPADGEEQPIKNSYLIANLATCACVFFVLLGASSLAFHSESVLLQPVHSFDILFGWLLVLNVAFASLCASFYAWAGRRTTRQLHAAAFVGFLVSIVAVVVQFDAIYVRQLEFYIAAGSVAVVSSVLARIVLVGERPSASTVGYAVGEILILLTVLASAIFCQGELVGRRVTRETDGV